MNQKKYEAMEDFVLVVDEGVLGVIVARGAYVSTVLYFSGGYLFKEIIENEDLLAFEEALQEEEL